MKHPKIKICTSPMTHLNKDVIVLFGETLSSKPGKSTVRAQSSANSSSLISDDTTLLKIKKKKKVV